MLPADCWALCTAYAVIVAVKCGVQRSPPFPSSRWFVAVVVLLGRVLYLCGGAVRFSLGKLSVNLLHVVKRTNTPLILFHSGLMPHAVY